MFQRSGDQLNKNLLDDEETIYGDVTCRLENIPINIKILGSQYILRGVAVFIGNRMSARNSMGHNVAITRRNDGHWEKYDDFKQKVSQVTKNTVWCSDDFLYQTIILFISNLFIQIFTFYLMKLKIYIIYLSIIKVSTMVK